MKWKAKDSDIRVTGHKLNQAASKVSSQQNAKEFVRRYGNGKSK